MQNIYFYPKLTDKLLENCGCSVTKYVFTYSYQGQDFGLLQKGSSTIRISDPREIWKIETEGLNFEKTVRIAYPNLLFGKDGVACSDAEIGIRFLYKGIIIKHNKTEPTYTKTSLFLCEKRRFFMARTEKGVVTTI